MSSSLIWIILIVLALTVLGSLALGLTTAYFYWGSRGKPPLSSEQRRLLEAEEARSKELFNKDWKLKYYGKIQELCATKHIQFLNLFAYLLKIVYGRRNQAGFSKLNKKALQEIAGLFYLVSTRGLWFKSRIFLFAFDSADLDEIFAFDGVFL